jgi:hypothetical protein
MFVKRRKRPRTKDEDGPEPIVKEHVEQWAPVSKRDFEEAPEEICDFNQAISKAVGRAISTHSPDLELTIDFPDRCKLFGESVASKGTVTIHKNGSDETDEAIRVVGRRVGEIESALDERLKRIESALEIREAPKATDAGPSETEQNAEAAPLF